jgi:hypothetical protein
VLEAQIAEYLGFFAESPENSDCDGLLAIAGDSVELTTLCYSRPVIVAYRIGTA